MIPKAVVSVVRMILLRPKLCELRKGMLWRRSHYCSVPLVIIFMLIVVILSAKIFTVLNSLPVPFDQLEKYRLSNPVSSSSNMSMVLNVHNHPVHHIYIDIGCYNGETIEHFIHFTPNSSLYDIITFEPDPENFRICQQRLTQEKYRRFNIIFIPSAVWIRDEPVYYRVGHGTSSGIDIASSHQYGSIPLDAIDFSRWLSRLAKSKRTKIRIKASMPGVELPVFEKMLLDNTFELVYQWDIEWSDRSNPNTRPRRIYIQSMLDSLGFDFLYLTRLPDVRKAFRTNGTFDTVPKHRDWMSIPLLDTYNHYIQRLSFIDPPRTTRVPVTADTF